MRLLCFIYDFPHYKSSQGLMALKANGFYNVTCVAAPFVKLNIKKSPTRIAPIFQSLPQPRYLCENLDYKYYTWPHEKIDADFLRNFDAGIVLGARILPKHLTKELPIINMHPGLIPFNRNLDNVKNAILFDIPQVVTTHIIDERVDMGQILQKTLINIYQDDTLLDIQIRMQAQEIYEMIRVLKEFDIPSMYNVLDKVSFKGNYFNVLSDEDDKKVNLKLNEYKANYLNMVEKWKNLL